MSDHAQPFHLSADQVPTREGYDRWSELYDADENPLVALEEPIVRSLIGSPAGLQVLDVGCGTGRHAAWLAARGARVTAIDFSEGMLSKARAKPECDGVEFRVHDLAQPLPFADDSFDRVVCGLVLDHISDLGLIFSEMRRVCKIDGFGLISVMHPAMSLLGVQARFTDPATGAKVQCGSVENRMCDYVMAILKAGWRIDSMTEHAVDQAVLEMLPRAKKYAGWPMALIFRLGPAKAA